MKLTKSYLKSLVKEALMEQINRKNFVPNDYKLLTNPKDISNKLAEVYIKDLPEENKWYLRAFWGKKTKPYMHYVFHSKEKRDQEIDKFYNSIRRWIQDKKERSEKRKSFVHDFKVGDILYSSWGYDQTNIDFFQVIKVSGKAVYYKEIEQANIDSSTVKPLKDHWKGSKIYKSIAHSNGLKVDEVRMAWLWNGKPLYQTPEGMGH